MTAVRNTDSVETVGEVLSCFVQSPLCLRPSAQNRPFTVLSLFSLRNMREEIAFFFSSVVRSDLRMGLKTHMLCICASSFVTPTSPLSLNFFSPAPMEYCCKITPNAYSRRSSTGMGFASLTSSAENIITPSRRMARLGPPRAAFRAWRRRV